MKPYYEHAGITIYNADCRDVLPTLDKASIDLVLTDPPYKHEHMDGGGLAAATEFYREGKIDSISDFNLEAYADVLTKAAQSLVAFHSRDLVPDYAALSRRLGWSYDLHVWHKVNAIPFCCNTWKSDLEYIALLWTGKKKMVRGLNQAEYSKLYQSGLETGKLHPTQKPIAIFKKYLRILQPNTVLDPFMGSGTTLRAAKDLGLKAIGIEIEEKYCEIAAKRLDQEVFNFDEVRAN